MKANNRYSEISIPETSKSDSAIVMYMRNWMVALRSLPTCRLGNRAFRFNCLAALLILVVYLCVVFFYVRISPSVLPSPTNLSIFSHNPYNSTYPLSPPILLHGMQTYRIGMVADLDAASKLGYAWRSLLKKGVLKISLSKEEIEIVWDESDPIVLTSSFALNGRGMELSELVTFNGKLFTFDDRTGLVYELCNGKPIPWVILLDGNGQTVKGFKSEWATVKDQLLYVGSMGKEWTTSNGEFENYNPMFVKVISPGGEVRSLDWSLNYKTLREEAMHIYWPGYMIHESAVWSDIHRKWFFLPRRCSKDKYNETRDEYKGCNLLISANEDFSKIRTVTISNTQATRGFSSFKFIPDTDDELIVAIKSEEYTGKTSTFITVFNIKGNILYADQRVPTDLKYEGIEFI